MPMLMNINQIKESVQHNCHIADAQFAGDYTLCVYLLKMREYYRWEMGHGYDENLPSESVGEWLKSREALWEDLEEAEYRNIVTGTDTIDPFETEEVNRYLNPKGLIYSGGLGCKCRPHFFLGELEREEQQPDYHLLVAGKELARDLTAPPAMSLGKTIFIRRESLRRMLWEKLEESHWDKGETPMRRAIAAYPFNSDLELALDQMTQDMMEQLILHEIGEVRAGKTLGEAWEELLAILPRSRIEILLRAVRDNYADSLSTLPGLLEGDADPQHIHFYMANLNGMRKQLSPSLVAAYQDWLENGSRESLKRVTRQGQEHWERLAHMALDSYQNGGEEALKKTQDLIEQQAL
jgi:hypothetical protein